MNVYIAKFENRPGLVKIGVAKNVDSRMAQLSRHHGKTTHLKEFPIGDGNGHLEKFLHKRFAAKNVQLDRCDGYTEFFCETVETEVEALLAALATDEAPVAPKRSQGLLRELKKELSRLGSAQHLLMQKANDEEYRCKAFLLRMDSSKVKLAERRVTGEKRQYESPMLSLHNNPHLPLFEMMGADQLGIPIDLVISTGLAKALRNGNTRMTPWRLRVVYKMFCGERSDRYVAARDANYEAVRLLRACQKVVQVYEGSHVKKLPTLAQVLAVATVEDDRLLLYGQSFDESDIQLAIDHLQDAISK